MPLLHHLQTKSMIPKFSSCSFIHLHMRVLEAPVTTCTLSSNPAQSELYKIWKNKTEAQQMGIIRAGS